MRAAGSSCRCWGWSVLSWGAWTRTRDHGTKTRCLTTWPRPNGRACRAGRVYRAAAVRGGYAVSSSRVSSTRSARRRGRAGCGRRGRRRRARARAGRLGDPSCRAPRSSASSSASSSTRSDRGVSGTCARATGSRRRAHARGPLAHVIGVRRRGSRAPGRPGPASREQRRAAGARCRRSPRRAPPPPPARGRDEPRWRHRSVEALRHPACRYLRMRSPSMTSTRTIEQQRADDDEHGQRRRRSAAARGRRWPGPSRRPRAAAGSAPAGRWRTFR